MKPKLISALVIIVLALVVLLQNSHTSVFRILFWSAEMSLSILVLLTLVIGCVLGFVVAQIVRRPAKDTD